MQHQRSSFSIVRICLLAAVTGVMAGVAAEALHRFIGFITNVAFYQRFSTEIVSPLESPNGVFMIFVPALGGLIVGIIAKYGTPLVRGHGIPEAMEAVLLNRSRIAPGVALLKPLSAGISLGSGQPFGAEGPIIQTGAALGSLLGQAFHTTGAERKVLLACGSAAGLAATFGTPIAAVIFAIELLLFEFRTRSFIPLVIASTIAAQMHISILGAEPVFPIGQVPLESPLTFVLFLVLGLLCGLVAIVLTGALYRIEDGFHYVPVTHYLYPALGGLFVGVVGYVVPKLTYAGVDVFGPGYYVIENILTDRYTVGFLLVLMLSKAAVWLVALGSGTSGGTLAPIFMIGAAAGALFGLGIQSLFPALDISPPVFAIAGMAAVFGSSTRATFASMVFAFEMTHRYEMLLPVMFTCVIADLVMATFMKTSLLTEQLRRSGILVNHEYEVERLSMMRVAEVMVAPVTIPAVMTVAEVADRISRHDPILTRHHGFVIIDENTQAPAGIITYGDLRNALQTGSQSVLEAGTRDLITISPHDTVYDAMLKMWKNDIGRLVVIDPLHPTQAAGYLSRTHILHAYFGHQDHEDQRDPGWVQLRVDRLFRNGKMSVGGRQ